MLQAVSNGASVISTSDAMKTLKYHTTQPYPCGYLPDKTARSEVVEPGNRIDTTLYNQLLEQGYRRSGHFIYRPRCDQCQACLSVRVKAPIFKPNRSQRRSWKKHCHLTYQEHQLHFSEEHFLLYQRYQAARHACNSADEDKRAQYQDFLLQSHVDTKLVTFYDNKQLCMISLIDKLEDGLSSVYTFYDPDIPHASLGTYNILWQIQLCKTLGLRHLYLGYWIKEHSKMNYKVNFRPLEILIDGHWLPYEQMAAKLSL